MADLDEKLRYLAHFLGPKGENEDLLKSLTGEIVQDYIAWRKSYQPKDRHLPFDREFPAEEKKITSEVDALLARLRGSFPIYSPRYIGHQLSETLITSFAGAFAGALYNSNNVTTEAGIVTVDLEIEACNALATMLGYRPMPDPPKNASEDEAYDEKLKLDFSWCHLTSGGTVANIEALWVARTIKYFPLAVRDICRDQRIPLQVELANGKIRDLSDERTRAREVLGMKPSASIALLSSFVHALMLKHGYQAELASSKAWEELSKSVYSPAKRPWKAYSNYPPCIMVSGAAHYSVKKAVDLLGIGREAIRQIDMTDDFRMDMGHLRSELSAALRDRQAIIAVVATIGTTEEGAVDPLHEILDIRRDFERATGHSFWVHADAAWGGFFKTLFVGEHNGKGELVESLTRLSARLRDPPFGLELATDPASDPEAWVVEAVAALRQRRPAPKGTAATKAHVRQWFEQAHRTGNHDSVPVGIGTYAARISSGAPDEFIISENDRLKVAKDFTADSIAPDFPGNKKLEFRSSWPHDDQVGRAFLAFGKADSITVDPHKMGYQVYPGGAVAFRNDRIRHFIQQKAAYVTLAKTEALAHHPVREAQERKRILADRPVATQAFAPFMIEGSRPSGPACSLWLASKTLPFNRENHGLLARSSLIAAKYLFDLIENWDDIKQRLNEDTKYELVNFYSRAPDTNIVIFGVKPKSSKDVNKYNLLTKEFYDHFSIQKEMGQEESIHTQPFFLSKTIFEEESYPFSTVSRFMTKKCGFRNAREEYKKCGLQVLRATVMSPHVLACIRIGGGDFMLGFMKALDAVADRIFKEP